MSGFDFVVIYGSEGFDRTRLLSNCCFVPAPGCSLRFRSGLRTLVDSFVIACPGVDAARRDSWRLPRRGEDFDLLFEEEILGLTESSAPQTFGRWTIWAERMSPYQRFSNLHIAATPESVLSTLFPVHGESPLTCTLPETAAGQHELRALFDASASLLPFYIATSGILVSEWRDYNLQLSVPGCSSSIYRRLVDCSFICGIDGPHEGRRWELQRGGSFTIGRGPRNDLRLDFEGVAAAHASFRHVGDHVEAREESPEGLVIDGAHFRSHRPWCIHHEFLDCPQCQRTVSSAGLKFPDHGPDHVRLEGGERIQIGPSTFEFQAGALNRPLWGPPHAPVSDAAH